jgi:hypothetical protein
MGIALQDIVLHRNRVVLWVFQILILLCLIIQWFLILYPGKENRGIAISSGYIWNMMSMLFPAGLVMTDRCAREYFRSLGRS